MTDVEKKIIEEAILNEVEGSQFYRMAAAQAPTEEAKEAFLHLAEEEQGHITYLKKLSEEMAAGTITVDKVIMEASSAPRVYKWGALDKKSLSLAMAAFSIAVQMERDSIAFYKDAKEKLSDEKSKAIFDTLIRWEEDHLQLFSTQYELYKREWWAEQGFSPL